MNDRYPEELTFDQIEDINWNRISYHESLSDAYVETAKHPGRIYTQVDAGQDRVYMLGVHKVNNTGWYAVAYKKQWHDAKNQPDEESGIIGGQRNVT